MCKVYKYLTFGGLDGNSGIPRVESLSSVPPCGKSSLGKRVGAPLVQSASLWKVLSTGQGVYGIPSESLVWTGVKLVWLFCWIESYF